MGNDRHLDPGNNPVSLLRFLLIWSQKFGFHNEWEFWLYQVVYGLVVSL